MNWLINNPWILSASKIDDFNKRYYFSAIDKSFNFIPLKIKNKKNEIIAFIIFAKRNNSLKMPFCYYEETHKNDLVQIINFYIRKLNISTFTCFQDEIVSLLRENNTYSIYKKSIRRKYLISKSFTFNEQNFNIQDGDGDCAFT